MARDLLGARLVRREESADIVAVIVETEAYQGEEDLACHARAGRTPRTQIMYGPGGFAYVYFTYGAHWMLNVVTDAVDTPAAVLIRAIRPVEGQSAILRRRPLPPQKKGAAARPASSQPRAGPTARPSCAKRWASMGASTAQICAIRWATC